MIGTSKDWYRSMGLLDEPPVAKPPVDAPAPPIDPPKDAFVDVPTVSIANNRNSQNCITFRKIFTARSVITSTMDLQFVERGC